jgi:hypothetical protein
LGDHANPERDVSGGTAPYRRPVPRRRRKKPTTAITITVPMMAETMPPRSKTSVSPMPRPTVKIR